MGVGMGLDVGVGMNVNDVAALSVVESTDMEFCARSTDSCC